MLAAAALSLLLAAEPAVDPARAELDHVAARIEALKSRQREGHDVAAELERLLVRAQDLAQRIERARREPAPPRAEPGPSPEELRERADALRDERDRVAASLRDVDDRIEDVRRERRAEAGLESLSAESALFGDPGASRLAPKVPPPPGTEPDPSGAQAGVLLGPRASGGEKALGTALQRLDRLRAERARLLQLRDRLEADAAALDAEAQRLANLR